ncbi:MAG TPA: glycosyltransferase family 4 protein [Myxococcota bacterium]|nr:glycosyltransferase family 4 protein [Myxococcota bacterium]
MSDRPPIRRVALFSPSWPLGALPNGVVSFVHNIREGFEALGVETDIIASQVSGEPGPRVVDLRRLPPKPAVARAMERILELGFPDVIRRRRFASLIAHAVEGLEEKGPVDVLEIEESWGLAEVVRRRSRVFTVVRLHGPWFLNGRALGVPEDRSFRRRNAWERHAIAAADAVSAPSRAVLEQVRGVFGLALPRAEVIPNPAPTVPVAERWRPEACEPDHILFVGRFDRHKGGDLMLDAFRDVLRERPTARLTFVGPDHGLVDDRGQRWGLPDYVAAHFPRPADQAKIHLHGRAQPSEIEALRRRAAVTAVASRYEIFGYTALEALAFGSPLVAPEVGGLREVVRQGVTGILFRSGDASSLATVLIDLLCDPARAARLGAEAARDAEERFGTRAIAAATLAFYERERRVRC